MIDKLREHETVELICSAFDVPTSSYYEYLQGCRRLNVGRLALRCKLKELFNESRGSAGSRTLLHRMLGLGYDIGRFKIRRLMAEAGLTSRQPGAHKYRVAETERLDIPNHLDREFDVAMPNQAWCGDITYIWANNRWHYLAVVMDLHCRRVVGWSMSTSPDAELAAKALDMAYQQRGKPEGVIVPLGPGLPICQSPVPAATVAISDEAEHEPKRQLLGQLTDGKGVPQPEVRVGTLAGLSLRSRSEKGHQLLLDGLLQLASATSV